MQRVSYNVDGVEIEEIDLDQIKYDFPELQSGKYYFAPIGGLTLHRCKIVWRSNNVERTPNMGYSYDLVPGEQSVPEGLPELEDDEDDLRDPEPTPRPDIPFQLGS